MKYDIKAIKEQLKQVDSVFLRPTRATHSDSMNHHILSIIVASFAYAENDCHCGLAKRIRFGKGERVERIRGGLEAEVGEFPWQVGTTKRSFHYIFLSSLGFQRDNLPCLYET